MIRRCRVPETTGYENYGGRGITVCDAWADDFWTFYNDVGPRPSFHHTLGRIDNDGNYEPGNVRWETWEQQANNRRNSALLTWDGRTQTITQWANELGLSYAILHRRWRLGMAPEAILCLDPVPARRSKAKAHRPPPLLPRKVEPKPITERQAKVLAFLREYEEARGYSPTLREIGAAVGIKSTNGVNDHLHALERKGFIVREDRIARSIRIIKMPHEAGADGGES